jgi:hypothetical protein
MFRQRHHYHKVSQDKEGVEDYGRLRKIRKPTRKEKEYQKTKENEKAC